MSQHSTLTHYQALTEHSDTLGCVLPLLHAGQLKVTPNHCQQQELAEKLAPWLNAEGWYQTASSTGIGMPEQLDQLLEGQWHHAGKTLHLTLLNANRYLLTEMTVNAQVESASADAPAQCYREQDIWLRAQLKSQQNVLRYRLWWQEQQGAWRPIMQQFIGLAQREEK